MCETEVVHWVDPGPPDSDILTLRLNGRRDVPGERWWLLAWEGTGQVQFTNGPLGVEVGDDEAMANAVEEDLGAGYRFDRLSTPRPGTLATWVAVKKD